MNKRIGLNMVINILRESEMKHFDNEAAQSISSDNAINTDDNTADPLDQASECTQLFNKMILDAYQQQKRMQEKYADERKRRGLAGICEDCAKRIPSARIKANPSATRCIHCQANYEKRSLNIKPWCK